MVEPLSSDRLAEIRDLLADVDRLKATLERVRAVADSPVEHQCERDGRAGWVRARDLQEALQDGESRG